MASQHKYAVIVEWSVDHWLQGCSDPSISTYSLTNWATKLEKRDKKTITNVLFLLLCSC